VRRPPTVAMPGKRSHSELEATEKTRSHEASGIVRKRAQTSSLANTGGVGRTKRRVRDIERLFKKDGDSLPSHVENNLHRELAAHKQVISAAEKQKRRSKMITKYHMVRFFGTAFGLRRQRDTCPFD
jgi:hypothetical protein